MLKIKNRQESSIDLNLAEPKDEKIQRSSAWFEKRRGCWTGSQIKNIMACNSAGGKMSWSNPEKAYEFSKGALKYVYSRAMERKTGRYIESPKKADMEYGTKVEPFILKLGEKLVGQRIIDVDFKQHEDIKTLGASSDGISEDNSFAVEIKACTNWGTHYDRTFEPVNEKSTDFWQTQIEMIVWGVERCAYLIAQPPSNIFDYLSEKKGFDDFKKECDISLEYIKASKFHQNAIIKRVQIVEEACQAWINTGGDLAGIFWDTVDKFKNQTEITGQSPIKGALKKVENEKNSEQAKAIKTPTNLDDIPF